MKGKSKFAYLLTAGGSLLSKDSLGKRLQLPHEKENAKQNRLARKSGRNGFGADRDSVKKSLPPAVDEAAGNLAGKQKREKSNGASTEKMPALMLVVEKIVRESRGAGKARNI